MLRRFWPKYRWKCKICGWKLRTNNFLTYEISRDMHVHLQEYKGVKVRTDKGAWSTYKRSSM